MAIIHRYIDELEAIENEQFFCDNQIEKKSNILIIGTFNPSDVSCLKRNDALWFYGRKKSKFWRYFPKALTGESLHPNDNHIGYPQTWQMYCITNKIVIIDLVKSININDILSDFGDREVDCKINFDLSNTEIFDVVKAFKGITFNKVIYSLAWKDRTINKLRKIKDNVNQSLLDCGCINDENQIKYCLTPSRNDAYNSWNEAIHK